MTINDFLAELKDVLAKPGYAPYVDEDKQLRIRSKEGDCFCPLTLVFFDRYNEFLDTEEWAIAASELGFDKEDAHNVIFAADNEFGQLRHDLVTTMFPVKKKFWFRRRK